MKMKSAPGKQQSVPWQAAAAGCGCSDSPCRQCAFTLVELLTVIAIIAVLGTLLLTALSSAQKKSRQARCAANLHQISLAVNMYLDDFDQRPRGLVPLTMSTYLPSRAVLICPQDKTGNWGGLVNPGTEFFEMPLRYSYLHPLSWDNAAWNRLLKAGSAAGVAACQVHGLGRPDPIHPSLNDFQGLVLRGRRDGAVVHRKVFWASVSHPGTASDGGATATPASGLGFGGDYPWPLFVDEQPEP
jgi:prepilin-type N-terminal cleavage/methylation domain-containing protein